MSNSFEVISPFLLYCRHNDNYLNLNNRFKLVIARTQIIYFNKGQRPSDFVPTSFWELFFFYWALSWQRQERISTKRSPRQTAPPRIGRSHSLSPGIFWRSQEGIQWPWPRVWKPKQWNKEILNEMLKIVRGNSGVIITLVIIFNY